MSVTPSPIGGFAAQFFDNNGVILSGGKIYTYAAGTTTPQATYTSGSGTTPHANPIILDSAGRVPGGEIWLTDGLVYKFVIETATSILIGTYDNITGLNSNFVNYTVQEEVITATAGQTVFNLSTINYTPGTNSLSVYIDGVNQYVGDSYLETDSDTVTFTSGVHVGGEVKFTTAIQTTTAAIPATAVAFTGFKNQTGVVQDLADSDGSNWIGFKASGATAVARSAEDKMRDFVSVKDFGAVGNGIADDTAAIQAAINAGGGQVVGTARGVYFPSGDYYISAPITIPNYTSIFGDGPSKSRINLQGKPYTSHIFTNADPVTWGWLQIQDFGFRGGSYGLYNASASQENWNLTNVAFDIQTIAGIRSNTNFQLNNLRNVTFYYPAHGLIINSGFMNMNNFDSCDFAGIANQAILAVGGSTEVNNFDGCRFEAGGVVGRSTIYLNNARNTNFYGCYIENTHDVFLDQINSSGATFHGCHFTGAIAGTTPYIFTSDSVVEFGANTWGARSNGPERMSVLGDNQNKLGKNNEIVVYNCKQKTSLVGPSTALAVGTNAINTVIFDHIFTSATLTDNAALFGEIKVIVQQVKSGGFLEQLMVTIPVFANIVSAAALGVVYGTTVINRDTTGATVTVTPGLISNVLVLTVAGVSASLDNGFVTWEFNSFSGASPTFNPITVNIA